jgi:hypothetical protein
MPHWIVFPEYFYALHVSIASSMIWSTISNVIQVSSLAMLFDVLHTAVKFESLHMLTTLLSQKESVRVPIFCPIRFIWTMEDFSLTPYLYFFWNTEATSWRFEVNAIHNLGISYPWWNYRRSPKPCWYVHPSYFRIMH